MAGLGLAPRSSRAAALLVVTGDGEMLMGLGSLATIGAEQPSNLGIVVLDNEHYGETGMQTAHTGRGVDLAGIAAATGFKLAVTVRTEAALESLAAQLFTVEGPLFAAVKVSTSPSPTSLPARRPPTSGAASAKPCSAPTPIASRAMIRAHLLRWRPRQPAQRTQVRLAGCLRAPPRS